MRMEGHAVHDDAFYVPRELLAAWRERDPIALLRAAAPGAPAASSTRSADEALRSEVAREVNVAVELADGERVAGSGDARTTASTAESPGHRARGAAGRRSGLR